MGSWSKNAPSGVTFAESTEKTGTLTQNNYSIKLSVRTARAGTGDAFYVRAALKYGDGSQKAYTKPSNVTNLRISGDDASYSFPSAAGTINYYYTGSMGSSGTVNVWVASASSAGSFPTDSRISVTSANIPAATYPVTYNSNGGSGTINQQAKTYGVNLTLASSGFTRDGYTLTGWNTASNGTGTSYALGGTYTGNAALALYAVWSINTWTVSYNKGANGTGTNTSATKTYGQALTLLGAIFTRDGYTQTGWSTSDGGLKAYDLNGSYTNNAAVTLYPYWTIKTYTVFYSPGSYGSGATIAPQTKTHGVALTLSSTTYTRAGYTQTGWSTSNGGAKAYNLGGSYTANAGVTLYPFWTIDTYTVSYNANGGTGAPGSQTKTYGVTLTLSSTIPTRTGYTFAGWGTSSTAATVSYAPGGSYTANAGATLYAVWTIITYQVSYNANGGSGAPSAQTKTYGVALTLSSTKPTRTGYTFLSWNTASDGSGTSYASGGSYTANAAATLYAQWKKNNIPVYVNVGGTIYQVEKAYANVNNQIKECTVYVNVNNQIKVLT